MDKKQVPEKDKEAYKPESFRLPLSRLSFEGDVLDFDLSAKEEPAPVKDKPGKDKKHK